VAPCEQTQRILVQAESLTGPLQSFQTVGGCCDSRALTLRATRNTVRMHPKEFLEDHRGMSRWHGRCSKRSR
jgi:hypothetical protein